MRTPWALVREMLREPRFAALWSSNLVHYSAWMAQSVMLQWLVTSLTDSRTVLGSVSFLQGAVIFATSPFAGVASDRLERRNLLLLGRLGLASVVSAIALLVALERIAIWHILVGAGAAGLLTSLMQPATQTFVFDVVRRERAQSAVALNVGAQSLGQTLGPLWGGAAVAVAGFVGAYLSAAAGLAVAALLLLLVPVAASARSPASPGSWLADLREGLAYVRAHPPVRLALVTTSLAVFNGAVAAMRPVFARHVLEVGSTGYGVMAGVAGAGALLAAFVMATLPQARRPGLMMTYSMLGFSTCILLYSFAFSFAWVLAVEFALGVFSQVWNVSTFTGLQLAVPDAMRGRIVSLVFTLVMLAPIGALFVGLLADGVGDQLALGIFGGIPMAILVGILALGSHRLRQL
jgi:MFS family permease